MKTLQSAPQLKFWDEANAIGYKREGNSARAEFINIVPPFLAYYGVLWRLFA